VSAVIAIDPLRLDRAIAEAAKSLAAARRALREAAREGREADVGSPLERHREVCTRSAWLELGEAPAHPVLAAARPWVHALTIDRVSFALEVGAAEAWGRATVLVEGDGVPREELSPRALLRRVLADPIVARRRVYARALERGSGRIAELARHVAERRVEAHRRLGADADAIELPCDATALAEAARAVLDRTAELVDVGRYRGAGFEAPLVAALGRDATEGWPARLSARWLDETFRGTELTRGLAIELGPLPEPLGAASFARALADFGDAFAVAAAPRAAPFVLRRRPFDVRRARRAALFASLTTDPTFGRHALGLGRDRAREQARLVARALLLSLRLDATRVLLRGALASDPRALAHRFEEGTERALGVPFPPALAGVVPSIGPADAVRFVGSLLAATDALALRDGFDEDWFRSPHAALALRDEEATLGEHGELPTEALEAAVRDLERIAVTRLE
jgi:hypothetical protein